MSYRMRSMWQTKMKTRDVIRQLTSFTYLPTSHTSVLTTNSRLCLMMNRLRQICLNYS